MKAFALCALVLALAAHAGARREEAGLLVLSGDGLVVGIAPDAGAHVAMFRTARGANFLNALPALWQTPAPPEPSEHVADLWRGYGFTVWPAPQHRWWLNQSFFPDRKKSYATWPPDPYLTVARYTVLEQTATKAVLRSPVSPYTGLRFTKTFTIGGGALRVQVDAENCGAAPCRLGLWFNFRATADCQEYVPVFPWASLRAQGDAIPLARAGWVSAALPETGAEKIAGKLQVDPAFGLIVATRNDETLLVQFAPTAPANTAPGHAPVEIYRSARPRAFLELEHHGPFRELRPGGSMSYAATWRILSSVTPPGPAPGR